MHQFGKAPGINPAHPMANKLRFSGVALPGNFLNLMSGMPGTLSGAPTYGMNANIGTVMKCGNSVSASFTGRSTVADDEATIAGIAININSTATVRTIFGTSSANNGFRFIQGSGDLLTMVAGGVIAITGHALAEDAPFLLMASWSTAKSEVRFLSKNLQTGKVIVSSTAHGSTPVAPNGTYIVGNSNFSSEQHTHGVAAVMFSAKFNPAERLREFANDPWAFWYPR